MVYFGISCPDALTFYLPPLAIIILSTLVHQQMLYTYCPPGLVSVREILSHATIQIKRFFTALTAGFLLLPSPRKHKQTQLLA